MDILQVLLRSVTFCHVLLRSLRSITCTHYTLSRSIPPWLSLQSFDYLKMCPGDYGNHGELRLSTTFPYVVLRSPRFVHGVLYREGWDRREPSVNVAVAIALHEIIPIIEHFGYCKGGTS